MKSYKSINLGGDWLVMVENHGEHFFACSAWVLFPTIAIYVKHGYYQLAFGWLNKSFSITFFNASK